MTNTLIDFFTVLLAVSLASETLVEIIKGLIPGLRVEKPLEPEYEAKRRVKLRILAVLCGILTAFLAGSAVTGILEKKKSIKTLPATVAGAAQPDAAKAAATLPETENSKSERLFMCLFVGLLAGGGSSFSNSILGYLMQVKGIKKAEAEEKKLRTDQTRKDLQRASTPQG